MGVLPCPTGETGGTKRTDEKTKKEKKRKRKRKRKKEEKNSRIIIMAEGAKGRQSVAELGVA